MRKALATIGITVLSILQCLTPAFAANTATTQITYTYAGNFTVTIPKMIELDSNKEASYTISVTGDVCGGEVVTVTPDSSFTLRDANGKSPVVATVTQGKTKFTASDINGTEAAKKQTEGNITAYGLTAGNWSGALSFTIDKKVELKPGLYDNNGALLCSWEDSGIDVEKDQRCESEEPDTTRYILTNTYPETTTVVIPNGIIRIGEEAFCGCSDLKSIVIPNSVTSIGNYAFDYCSSLTSVTIPNSVTSIGVGAFSGCSKLTSATFNTTTGWYVGNSAGAKTTAISSSNLANKSTAATYLKSTYCDKYWTR